MGKQIFKYASNYTVFDIETTGLSPAYNRIVEISSVKVRNGEIVDTFSKLINPECTVGESRYIHGISDEMLIDAPKFKDIAGDFLDFIGQDILVGHNIAKFDIPFVTAEIEKIGLALNNDYSDSLKLARAVLKNMYRYTLGDLSKFYGISTDGAHRALNDCIMNQAVYERIWTDENSDINRYGKCPRCGNILVKREGRFGDFLGCIGFPDCKFTMDI